MTSFKKELSYGSFEEFLKKAEFDFSTFNFNNLNICNVLLKLYDKGNSLLQTGEDENAYFLLMRFFEGYLKLKKSKLYKDDRKYVDDLIPGDKLRKAVETLEKLKVDIKKRYEEKENKSKANTVVSKIDAENLIKNEIVESKKAAMVPVPQDFNEKRSLSPSEFIELVTKTGFTLLLIDLRESNDFNLSFMNLNIILNETRKKTISYINIPSSLVETVTWKLEESLKSQTKLVNVYNKSQSAAHVFQNRSQFDFLILFDHDSEYLKLKSDSKLFILKRAVFDYADSTEKCKNEPIILDGGWKTWIFYYPGYTLMNKKPIETDKEPIKSKSDERKAAKQSSDSNTDSTKNIRNDSNDNVSINNKPSEANQIGEKLSAQQSNKTSQEKEIENEQLNQERAESVSKNIDKNDLLFKYLPNEYEANNQERRQVSEAEVSSDANRNGNLQLNNKSHTPLIPTVDRSNKPSSITKTGPDITKYSQTNTKEIQDKMKSNQENSEKENTVSENANKFIPINRQAEPKPLPQPTSFLPNAPTNVTTNLNETIFNAVYAPTRTHRSFQTPYMKDGTKVLDPNTGMFSYVPQLSFLRQPSSSSLQQPLTKNVLRTNETEIKPPSTQLPSFINKSEPKSNTNLKRTLSSPNIAKLDDEQEFSDDSSEVPHMPHLNKLTIKPTTVIANAKPMVNRNNKPMSEQVVRSRMEELQPVFGNNPPGLTGIKNLGNTCFINSIIQCLSSCQKLVEYFMIDKFKEDLNRTNDLGFRGEIADEFSIIVKAIWSGHCRIISPRRFKIIIGQFNQQFISNEQQDAQELLLFLLDGLHEDLNRVIGLNHLLIHVFIFTPLYSYILFLLNKGHKKTKNNSQRRRGRQFVR
jgi:ubiquitin carboxyl-terminal hydrolase 8